MAPQAFGSVAGRNRSLGSTPTASEFVSADKQDGSQAAIGRRAYRATPERSRIHCLRTQTHTAHTRSSARHSEPGKRCCCCTLVNVDSHVERFGSANGVNDPGQVERPNCRGLPSIIRQDRRESNKVESCASVTCSGGAATITAGSEERRLRRRQRQTSADEPPGRQQCRTQGHGSRTWPSKRARRVAAHRPNRGSCRCQTR